MCIDRMKNYLVIGVVAVLLGVGGGIYLMKSQPTIQEETLPVLESNADPIAEMIAEKAKPTETPKQEKKVATASVSKPLEKQPEAVPVLKPTVFRIAADVSTADFRVGEVLNGEQFTALGTTSDVSGTISLDWATPSKTVISPIKVNARLFKTESASRDSMIRRFILKSEESENEYIVFEPTSITGMPKTVTFGKPIVLSLVGNLTIAGVTKPVTFTASATVASKNALSGSASATVKRADYNIVVPSVPFVASVGEEVKLSINLNAQAE